MKKIVTLVLMLAFSLICVNWAFASFGYVGTLNQVAADINYGGDPKNLTVYIYYNCTGIRQFNITFPAGFSLYATGSPCGLLNNTLASCNFQPSSPFNLGSYTFQGSTTLKNYSVVSLETSLSNYTECSVTSNITIVRIPNTEIFQTLVEYGRGRGNYFYSTFGDTAGSGHTGYGCSYVPNNTMFELNFLHKMYNIRQYFNDYSLIATNATFTCTYPNRTIVRTHSGTSITKTASETNVTYFIDEIEGSWERMGYLGMQFDASEQQVGENLTISCADIKYSLPGLGNVTVYVNGISFDLQVRDPYPFIATASASTSTVGNGTQEVLITYNITNNELYNADSVIIEIQAPQYSTFIGTRGELWGVSQDQYRIEKMELQPGESEVITLVARFDTTNAPNITTLDLAQGIKIKYTTCWELNAYNPAQYTQTVYNIGNTTVNMAIPVNITSVIEQVLEIYNITYIVNNTLFHVNNTVEDIKSIVVIINTTTTETNTIVKQINTTVTSIYNKTLIIYNNTNDIINHTTAIKELLDCDNVSDTPMCAQLDSINYTIVNITNIIRRINMTLNNLTVSVLVNLSAQNLSVNVTPDLTNITIIIHDIKAELNCSNVSSEPNASICMRLIRIENNTIIINDTIREIDELILYFNDTVFDNLTLEDIYNKLSNVSIDISDILEEIERIRSFDDELVFLVTDAFNLQKQAVIAANSGHFEEATGMLMDANLKLNDAMGRLVLLDSRFESERQAAASSKWWVWAVLLAGICASFIYLSKKMPEEG